MRAVGSSIGSVVMGADGRTLRVDEDECYHEIEHTPERARLLGEWDRLGLGLGDERTPEQKQAWRAHLWHAHLTNMSGAKARRAPSVARGARPRGQRGRRARRAASRGACRAGPGDDGPEPPPRPRDVTGPRLPTRGGGLVIHCPECGAGIIPAETASAFLEAAQDRLHARVEAALAPLPAGPEQSGAESVSPARRALGRAA